MTGEQARRRFITARVARLATVGGDGRPHLVPIVFALTDETIVSAIDAKPMRRPALRRLANIATNPHVAVLDHYEDDWDRLWWVRVDGTGHVLDPAEPEAVDAVARLAARYSQYRRQPPAGPVLAIDVERWSGWSA